MTFQLDEIQKSIQKEQRLDGWLIYDFKGRNQLANSILQIKNFSELSRRFFYWIPISGAPIKIHHFIEKEAFEHLPGIPFIYSSWQEMKAIVEANLKGKVDIAMEYSPMNEIPTLSLVDAGTVEWLRSLKITIRSSWPLLERFASVLSEEQIESHKQASKAILNAMDQAKNYIRECIKTGKDVSDRTVQKFVHDQMTSQGYITNSMPIVAVNENAAKPHYAPSDDSFSPIMKGDFVLFDFWYKKNQPQAVYADHAQVFMLDNEPYSQLKHIYSIVQEAQSKALEFLEDKIKRGEEVLGYQVDDVARGHIKLHGLSESFIHRTGHNIFTDVHGSGVNLDNFETHDARRLVPNTCYSIEPGIYVPDAIGVRLECNVIIKDRAIEVTNKAEKELPCFPI